MTDYYAILSQKIGDTKDDPARIREVIYEAARLGLKRQVFGQKPPMQPTEAWRHLNDLDEAIKRLEADTQAAEALERTRREEAAAAAAAEALERKKREEAAIAEALERSNRERAEAAAAAAAAAQTPPPATLPVAMEPAVSVGQPTAAAPPASAPEPAPATIEPAEAASIAPAASPPIPPAPTEAELLEMRRMQALEETLLGRLSSARDAASIEKSNQPQRMPISAVRSPNRRPARIDASRLFETPASSASPDNSAQIEAGPRDAAVPSERSAARRPAAYLVNPQDFVSPHVATQSAQPPPRSVGSSPLMVALVVSQLIIALLAGVSLYFAVWGRGVSVQTAQSGSATLPVTPSNETVPARYAPPQLASRKVTPVTAAPVATSPAETAPAETARIETAPVEAAPVETAPADIGAVTTTPVDVATPEISPGTAAPTETTAAGIPPATPTIAALPFPRPPGPGVYAVENGVLIPLQRIAVAPVDARPGNPLQITLPSRTRVGAAALAFVAYRPGLTSRAPELVRVRIAARLSQSMNYDSVGRAVITKPPVTAWIVRDEGYDLRVSAVPGSNDMLMLRPVNQGFSFPPGRYELVIDGDPYDFVVAGEVTDPAHCVEGLTTARGPSFYACKSL